MPLSGRKSISNIRKAKQHVKNSNHVWNLPGRSGIVFHSVCIVFFVICTIVMIFRIMAYHSYGNLAGQAASVTQIESAQVTVNGETKPCSLPTKLKNLDPGTPVEVTFTLNNASNDTWMQIRTAFAPVTVYENGKKVYELGSKDTRPSFMKDPGTMIQFIQVKEQGEVEITLHYTSPTSRNFLTVSAPLISNQAGLLRYDSQKLEYVMGESFVLLIGGLLLAGISVFIIHLIHEGVILLCIGVFTAITGLWGISNCDLVLFFLNDPSLWYIVSYVCFFSILIPLEMFLEEYVHFHFRKLLQSLHYALCIMVPLTVMLQLTGTVMFSQSVRIYQCLLPASILAFTVGVIWEAARYRSRPAGQMIPGMVILSLSTIAELFNYSGSLEYDSSFYYLFGTGIFCLYMCFVGAVQVRRSYEDRRKAHELERQLTLMNQEIIEQKKYQDMVLSHERQLRRLRHDYRHQITVLQEFARNGETEELSAYLSEMMKAIPQNSDIRYTQNIAVNAVIAYYASQAKKKGVQTDIDLQLAATLSMDMEQSLCVVFGNLLENACEAIDRLDRGDNGAADKGGEQKRFIRLSAVEHQGNLIIHMENSMDGKIRKWGRFYISSKRQEVGIGLSSISNIAEMHGGDAEFHGENGVFVSDVYMELFPEDPQKYELQRDFS
ncbi:GHKL domain-containing protein [Erysipelotrichaceae bacterium Oil+RF-744-GAM-WT-6]|uniref:GHKL domain-containing protein n=2 Tax=Stecheria intestinalis TaxID=2606630 RepID=A0A7X2NT86_9FIRM|nr:GHKL domain-containing protein [Stecheria intestinalis]